MRTSATVGVRGAGRLRARPRSRRQTDSPCEPRTRCRSRDRRDDRHSLGGRAHAHSERRAGLGARPLERRRRDRVAGGRQRRRRHDGRADLPGVFVPGESEALHRRERRAPRFAAPKLRVYAVHDGSARRRRVGERPHRVSHLRPGTLEGRFAEQQRPGHLGQARARPDRRQVVREGSRRVSPRHRRRRRLLRRRRDRSAPAAPAIWRGDKLYRALNFKGWRVIAQRVRCARSSSCSTSRGTRAVSSVSETKRIALDAGHNLNHIVSIFRAENGRRPTSRGSTGIVKRPSVVGSESKAQPWAWLAEWGPLASEGRRAWRSGHRRSCCRATRSSTGRRRTITTWPLSRAKSGEPVSY